MKANIFFNHRFLKFIFPIIALFVGSSVFSQDKPVNDVTKPLHLLQPDYPIPYGQPTAESVVEIIDRVYNFLNEATPARLIDSNTKKEITNLKKLNHNAAFAEGLFRLTSYEWGVTYAAMLNAGKETGEKKYTDYTKKRLNLIVNLANYY